MNIKIKQFEYYYYKADVYLLFVPIIIISKIIRYTIMKTVLVDQAIGYKMLVSILQGTTKFELFSSVDDTVDASGNAAHIFSFFSKFGLSTYVEYEIVITIIFNIVLLVLLRKVKNDLTTFQMFFIVLSIAVLNIFDFTLAKEPIQMLYFILCFYILTSYRAKPFTKYIGVIAVILLSVLTYRTYYILVLLFGMEAWFFFKIVHSGNNKRNGVVIYILSAIAIVITYYVILQVCKVVSPSIFSELFRVRTRASTASTAMRSIFNSSNVLIFSFDYLLMIVRMLFPLELLPMGVKYFPYVVFQLMITISVIRCIFKYSDLDISQRLALYIYVGFLLASGTFEPDFGSWVRHEAVLFPLMLIMNDMIQENQYLVYSMIKAT